MFPPQSHADLPALIVTVVVLFGSWVWELKRWIERRQKNVADRYNREIVLLMNRAQVSTTMAELERIRMELLPILTEAVRDLDEDRMSEESFQTFRVVWQIAVDSIRERRAAIIAEPGAWPVEGTERVAA